MDEIKIDFTIIGAHRTGTTWLYEKLYQHPEIILSSTRKELHFFDRDKNFNKGLSFYADHFPSFNQNKYIGDSTPAYLSKEEVPKRIHALFPDIKIIVILRDPVERLYSHFKLNSGNHNVKESFSSYYQRKIIEKNEGKYIDHIKEYLKYFDKNNMLFILYDDLKENPKAVYKNSLEFIGVNNVDYMPKRLDEKINAWGIKKYNAKSRLLYTVMLAAKKFKLFKLSSLIEKYNAPKTTSSVSEKDRRILLEYYRTSIEELETFLDKDLKKWKS